MAVEFEIQGVRRLRRQLDRLPVRVTKKHARRAISQGAALVRERTRLLAPIKTGKLRRNIVSRARRGTRGAARASVQVRVGPRTQGREFSGKFMAGDGRSNPKDAYYWRFLEYGTKHIAPRPFVRPAAEQMFRPVVRHVVREIDRGIATELRK